MVEGGNPLRASKLTGVFARNNRGRQQGSSGWPAMRTRDGADPSCYNGGGVNADTGSSVRASLFTNSIRIALEAACLQWVQGEKE